MVNVVMWSSGVGSPQSPDEARLKQTPYPFHTQLIWRYLGIKLHFIGSIKGAPTIAGGLKSEQVADPPPPSPLTLTTGLASH